MPATSSAQDHPPQVDGTYRRWDLPAAGWSGAEYGEDHIKIINNTATGEWWGCTEYDQCVHRDLDDEQLASVRHEFNLV